MNYVKLFKEIKTAKYKKIGDDVDYCIVVDEAKKEIRLLFAPSQTVTDWKNNLNFIFLTYRNLPGKVYKKQESCLLCHRGFAKAYKSANDTIMAELKDCISEHPEFRVYIAGWSLGGAMAILAVEDLYFREKIKSNLVTFGAPKVLFGRKTEFYFRGCISSCFQLANYNDLVTYMPPFPGYRHVFLPGYFRKGEKFNLKKIFDVQKYHCNYDRPELY